MNHRLKGLYAITGGRHRDLEHLASMIAAAIDGGATVVQYRDKSSDQPQRVLEAEVLVQTCRRLGAVSIINDDVALALTVAADGVHLGRDDADIGAARTTLGKDRLIGVSCYNRFDLAEAAAGAGADYIAFGSFFPSPTKPNAVRADPDLLHRARRMLALPTVAIGGISPENGAALVNAGADMLAVISALFARSDITAAAQAFAPCFNPAEESQP